MNIFPQYLKRHGRKPMAAWRSVRGVRSIKEGGAMGVCPWGSTGNQKTQLINQNIWRMLEKFRTISKVSYLWVLTQLGITDRDLEHLEQ